MKKPKLIKDCKFLKKGRCKETGAMCSFLSSSPLSLCLDTKQKGKGK